MAIVHICAHLTPFLAGVLCPVAGLRRVALAAGSAAVFNCAAVFLSSWRCPNLHQFIRAPTLSHNGLIVILPTQTGTCLLFPTRPGPDHLQNHHPTPAPAPVVLPRPKKRRNHITVHFEDREEESEGWFGSGSFTCRARKFFSKLYP